MLVEDDPDLRDWYREVLEAEGYRVTACDDGDEALGYFEDCLLHDVPRPRVDCIVSDVRMPGCTGLDLVRFIEGEGRYVPTVLVTGFAGSQTWEAAQNLGVASVLDKPVRARDLVRSVHDALGRVAS